MEYFECKDSNLNRLLHYLKGVESFLEILKHLTKDIKNRCPFKHGKKIEVACYDSNPAIIALLQLMDKYIICCKVLDLDKYTTDEMDNILIKLKHPKTLFDYKMFQIKIKRFRELSAFLEANLKIKLEKLQCKECIRLDEAIVCFQNYCFYSTVIMAVSTVESRLHDIIKKNESEIYSSYRFFGKIPFSKATLGMVVGIFDEKNNDAKLLCLKKLIPKKHKPLLGLLNEYRVFSAHLKDLKEEAITPKLAESILSLAIAFLTDPAVCPYDKEELFCNSEKDVKNSQ